MKLYLRLCHFIAAGFAGAHLIFFGVWPVSADANPADATSSSTEDSSRAASHANNVPEFYFGPEFTFGIKIKDGQMYSLTDGFLKVDIFNFVQKRMYKHLVENQPPGSQFRNEGTTFWSPNGWDFELKQDQGVIEIVMNKMTVSQFRRYQVDIQDAIFISAANEYLFPALFTGGGHINLGVKEFEGHSLLLRNFIVDYFNHAELALGVMSYDTNNALPFILYEKETQNEILKIIHDFDKDSANQNKKFIDYQLLSHLSGVLQNATDPFGEAWRGRRDRRSKMHALSFHRSLQYNHDENKFSDKSRLEIRAVRPQASMDVWVRQIELFQKRLEYLATIDHPIPYKSAVKLVDQVDALGTHKLNPPVKPQEALRAFYKYVTESGLKWQDHRDYLWPKWLSDGEVDKFEKSKWFQKQEKRNQQQSCELALS